MDKALIEKAFNKFMDTAEPTVDYEVGYLFDDGTAKYFERACLRLWCAGATWQREQLEAVLKEAKDIIKEGLCDYCSDLHYKEKCNLCSSVKYLAKLDLLEGEK